MCGDGTSILSFELRRFVHRYRCCKYSFDKFARHFIALLSTIEILLEFKFGNFWLRLRLRSDVHCTVATDHLPSIVTFTLNLFISSNGISVSIFCVVSGHHTTESVSRR